MTTPAYELAAREAWAIEESALKAILEIAARENRDIEALEAERGEPLRNARSVTVRDGVAVVPVVGPLFRRANLFTMISGATSFDILARDLTTALTDSQVRAVLLSIDSPGGTVNGTNEFAKMVRRAVTEGDKPVIAYVGGQGASAAYWIASAAGQIFADETAELGSIGVVAGLLKSKDPRVIEFVSSQSPRKRPDPESDEGRVQLQGLVDGLAQIFIDTVAANRGTDPERVASEFGQGGVLLGAEAVRVGMADGIATEEQIISRLAGGDIAAGVGRRFFSTSLEGIMTTNTPAAPAAVTAATIAAQYPEVAASLRAEGEKAGREAAETAAKSQIDAARAEGRAEGATAERERILGIQAAAFKGQDDLVTKAIEDGMDVGAAALAFNADEKQKGERHLSKLAADEPADLPQPGTDARKPAAGKSDPLVDDGRPLEARAKEHWEANAEVRGEFKSFATYHAFLQAEAKRKQR